MKEINYQFQLVTKNIIYKFKDHNGNRVICIILFITHTLNTKKLIVKK